MKRKIMTTTLTLAAMTGSSFAAIQIWTDVDTSAGWDSTTAEWENDGAPGVPVAWVNDGSSDAVIGGAGGSQSITEDIALGNLTYNGADSSLTFNGGHSLTASGTVDGGSKGLSFKNTTLNGTFSIAGGATTMSNGSVMAGTVTVNSGGLLKQSGSGLITGNVNLNGGKFSIRSSNVQDQTMTSLTGNGQLQNLNTAAAATSTVNIGNLALGTDGTIGEMTSGKYNVTLASVNLDLAIGIHQFDLNSAGGTLTNDFLNVAQGLFGVDVDGATIALSATGDALLLGDTFQLVNSDADITGTALWDFSDASLDSGLAWDTSAFNTTGFVTVVPEPSSTALLGLGGLALILRRRK